ncbi:hypothetical protein [Glaesserella parasuis]|uniref:hypothetical protein n=1 Tax=Glaesserella parasuis TaxID=738 RepID=UPI001F46F276|nr:hypothetical protein [Glaesserella parasuis]
MLQKLPIFNHFCPFYFLHNSPPPQQKNAVSPITQSPTVFFQPKFFSFFLCKNSQYPTLLTYGENKGITISTGNNNTNASSNIFLGSDDVEKLNLMLAHKDEIIKLKDDVIESLRNEISLLKEKLSAQ